MSVIERAGPGPPRLRYLDLVRVMAVGTVVVGHWLIVDITYSGARLVGRDALAFIGWAGWLTLVFQVMPLFFVVGGYVNAMSWVAHRERGVSRAGWVHGRAERLLWPTTVYLALTVVMVVVLATGLDDGELAQAGQLLTLHLWFLAVYLMLIMLTPMMFAAHQRWGRLAAILMSVAAVGVDVAVLGLQLPAIGYANYLLVWGAMHQWGFAWRDGALTRGRRPAALAGVGVVCFTALVTLGPYPVAMIGAGERAGNTSPPSVALLAFAAVQTGLVIAVVPTATRFLLSPTRWRWVRRLNSAVITVYLWHMVPVLAVALTLYRSGVVPQPRIGSWAWWVGRPLWIATLAVALVPVVLAVTWLQRPLRRIPVPSGPVGRTRVVLMYAGVIASGFGLVRLSADGAAPAGRLAIPGLLVYACGSALTMITGRGPRTRSTGPAGLG